MSRILEFPFRPLPANINSPPYVTFGINGTDITSALPPRISLNLVLHFTPTLRKWILPAPDPTSLPLGATQYALRTPAVGIDIRAPIEAAGLVWILTRMLHLAGAPTRRETFTVLPDLDTALAVHSAWLALELPRQGLAGLHVHMTAQLLLGTPAVGLRDMQRVWGAFPPDSEVVWAMGVNFKQTCAEGGYECREGLEMAKWIHSTAELWAFFRGLRNVTPVPVLRGDGEAGQIPAFDAEDKRENITIGRRAGKAIRKPLGTAIHRPTNTTLHQLSFRDPTPTQRRQAREESDFLALKQRLRRAQSDDSMRSVDTTLWIPGEGGCVDGDGPAADEQWKEGEGESYTITMTLPSLSDILGDHINDPVNNHISDDVIDHFGDYVGGDISGELAASLETIRRRREARLRRGRGSG